VGEQLTAMVGLTPLEGKIKCCIKLLPQPSFLAMPAFGALLSSFSLSVFLFNKVGRIRKPRLSSY